MDPHKQKPIDWAEMLNEAALWHDYSDFKSWFSIVAAPLEIPSEGDYLGFRAKLNLIRREAARLYFGEAVHVGVLNEKLSRVKLSIDYEAVRDTRFPALLAQSDRLLDRVFGGLLAEFASFVAESLTSGKADLSRCQGLYRDERAKIDDIMDVEQLYRSEIEVIKENNLLNDPSIQRCFDFFIGRPKARFCSDTCRFNTFQISKQYNDPDYLAEKQRRYRKKLQS